MYFLCGFYTNTLQLYLLQYFSFYSNQLVDENTFPQITMLRQMCQNCSVTFKDVRIFMPDDIEDNVPSILTALVSVSQNKNILSCILRGFI